MEHGDIEIGTLECSWEEMVSWSDPAIQEKVGQPGYVDPKNRWQLDVWVPWKRKMLDLGANRVTNAFDQQKMVWRWIAYKRSDLIVV